MQLQRRCCVPRPFAEYDDLTGRGRVEITTTYEYKPDTQIKRITTRHTFVDEGRTEQGTLNMRMFFPQELDALLRYNGFRIRHKWGDHERSAFGPDSALQVVLSTPSQT